MILYLKKKKIVPRLQHWSDACKRSARNGTVRTTSECQRGDQWQSSWPIGEARRAHCAPLCGRNKRSKLASQRRLLRLAPSSSKTTATSFRQILSRRRLFAAVPATTSSFFFLSLCAKSFRPVFARIRRGEERQVEVFVWFGCKINLFCYNFLILICFRNWWQFIIYIVDLVPRGGGLPRGCWYKQRGKVRSSESKGREHVRGERMCILDKTDKAGKKSDYYVVLCEWEMETIVCERPLIRLRILCKSNAGESF